jgi:hypothetical protein
MIANLNKVNLLETEIVLSKGKVKDEKCGHLEMKYMLGHF